MTRTMGDAIHANVPALHAAGLPIVAGYVTGGTPGLIQWTPEDFALFNNIPVVTIDQGFTGSPVLTANVRDVEPGAWTAAHAANLTGWTAPRPTIYCSVSALPGLAATGWHGDIWVAWYNGNPGLDFTVPAGMTCVAKQYTDTGGGGAYDLSAVFDPYWPLEAPMALSYEDGWRPCTKCSGLFNIVNSSFGWGNVCPAGGAHQSGTSGTVSTYALTVDGTVQAGS